MKDKKTWTTFTIIIAIIAVVTFAGIAYAAFSQQLDINGSATVSATSWKIKFANLQPVSKTGSAKELTAPTINTNDTKIGDYSVTLTLPGDSVSYSFDVVNEGTLDAQISSLTIPTPTCTGSGDNSTADATNVCDNISYTLKYSDGTAVQTSDALEAGKTKSMVLTLTYSSNVTADKLPKNDVAISNLSAAIVYSQS